MRTLFFGNNWLGLKVVEQIRASGDEIVGAVLHSPKLRTYHSEIVAALGLPPEKIIESTRLKEPGAEKLLAAFKADIAVSAMYKLRISPTILEIFPKGAINIHPSLLPHNRGANPNVWSLVNGTPAGVTIHFMDADFDTGNIISQQEVPVAPTDTGETLYRKLERAAATLFTESWPTIKKGTYKMKPQPKSSAKTFTKEDFESLCQIDLNEKLTARQFIDRLRALTFPPHQNAYFEENGKRYFLELRIAEGK